MSDLDPLIKLPVTAPAIQDPAVTHIVLRREASDDVEPLANVARTSCSFLILGGPDEAALHAHDTEWFDEAQIRREFLVVADGEAAETMTSLRSKLAGTGITWQVCEKVLGGRASVLAEAVEYAANEFLAMSFGVGSRLDRVPSLLGHMWVEGADVGVLGADAVEELGQGFPQELGRGPDAAEQLTAWLGLSGPVPEGSLVLMRRWVARWLFNEISRSIDPAEELADRARLLGLTIVHLA